MAIPDTLSVGLKEWASLCGALGSGRQMLLLRKGGIYESSGEFEIEHPRFLLFPTYSHQKPEMVKEGDRGAVQARTSEPDRIELSLAGEVTDIVQLRERGQMDRIDAEHIWLAPLVDMRFNYRPENPLYLVLVRVYRLAKAITVENTPAYAGCKSWVPLEREIDTRGAVAVVNDERYGRRRDAILSVIES